jgi:hypothetical protein
MIYGNNNPDRVPEISSFYLKVIFSGKKALISGPSPPIEGLKKEGINL